MLYWLHHLADSVWQGFNVFKYISFRSAYALITALLISFLVGPWLIGRLRQLQLGEKIREEGPPQHKAKAGTPSMGGLMILTSIIVPTLLWADLANPNVQLVLAVTVWTGMIGFLDDWLKIVKGKDKGLVGRYKLIGQLGFGLLLGLFIYFLPPEAYHFPREAYLTPIDPDNLAAVPMTRVGLMTEVPFVKQLLYLGIFYVPLALIVVAGTSNAVNLTDGLDGLAIGVTAFIFLAFTALAYVSGHKIFAWYLHITYMPNAGELTVFCSAVVGASLGFLWFNSHPAEVFMGDTGSLPLGGALGTLAVLLKKELLLVILGGLLVAETLSVMIQVTVYRRTGRRVFRMAPLHHHFELLGWAEQKITVRFWILAALLALLGLTTLKLR